MISLAVLIMIIATILIISIIILIIILIMIMIIKVTFFVGQCVTLVLISPHPHVKRKPRFPLTSDIKDMLQKSIRPENLMELLYTRYCSPFIYFPLGQWIVPFLFQ